MPNIFLYVDFFSLKLWGERKKVRFVPQTFTPQALCYFIQIRFALLEPSDYFTISTTGEIKSRVVLDYESAEVATLDYELTIVVQARDLAKNPPNGLAYTSATVTITIEDVDDEVPYFTNTPMLVRPNLVRIHRRA